MAIKLILKQNPQKQKLVGLTLICLGIFILSYLLFIKFSFSFDTKAKPQASSFAQVLGETLEPDPGLTISKEQVASFGSILGLKNPDNSTDQKTTAVLPEFYLSIPRLNIKNARVLTNVDGTSKEEYLKSLKEAVAHFKGTALPGEVGNIFLFGHSMLPILARGQYESIFTKLPKLQKNDVVKINYNNQELTYQVEQTAVVGPNDVFVLNQNQTEQKITLMTCIPPGFGEKRFVVIGKLID